MPRAYKQEFPTLPKPFPHNRESAKKSASPPCRIFYGKNPPTNQHTKAKAPFWVQVSFPPNAYVTLDCEFILLFRKGKLRKFEPKDALRYESAFTKTQRNEWFSQIWNLKGTRQTANELERRTAAYPEEIAERLIRMFSVKCETILDPFLGSGTTVKVAIANGRNSVGYESDKNLLPVITKKIGHHDADVAIIKR